MYVDTVKMLDTFSKDIIYKDLPPPYTQTLFIELIRFSPGQPDTVLANGSSSHPGGTSFAPGHLPSQPPPANGHTYHPRAQPPPPPPRAPIHPYSPPHRINVPAAHMPPPPPWEIKWTRPVPPSASAAANSTPASSSSVGRLSISSSSTVPVPAPAPAPAAAAVVYEDIRLPAVPPLTPPSASRKRKYPEGDVATGRTSPYGSGSPSYKRPTPTPASAEPMDHHTPSQTPAFAPRPAPSSSSSSSSSSASASSPAAQGPASSGHRPTQTLSPSLAMIMSPDSRHMPPFVVGTSSSASASLPATPPQQQRKVKLTYTNGEGTPR